MGRERKMTIKGDKNKNKKDKKKNWKKFFLKVYISVLKNLTI